MDMNQERLGYEISEKRKDKMKKMVKKDLVVRHRALIP
jgi:hypothetical protein